MSNSILFKIPEQFLSAYSSGSVARFGAVLKDTATGQIVGHVQETGALSGLAGGIGNALSSTSPFSMISGVGTLVQNEQIKNRLEEVQGALGILQGTQYATLAVSGLGLGVSVAGFALLNRRLNVLSAKIDELSEKIDAIPLILEKAKLRERFTDIATLLDRLSELSHRRNFREAALKCEAEIHDQQGHIKGALQKAFEEPAPETELLWTLLTTLRVCYDARLHLLMYLDEFEFAAHVAGKQTQEYAALTAPFNPENLSRRLAEAQSNGDFEMGMELRKAMFPQVQAFTRDAHESTERLASRSSLISSLDETGISGREYIENLKQEILEPVLVLPRMAA